MSMTRRRTTGIAAAGVAAGVLALGATAGIAYASTSPTPSPTGSSATAGSSATGTTHAGKRKHKLATAVRALHSGRALHGDIVVMGKDHKTLTLQGQRGVVSSVSSTSLSVKSLDGYTATYTLGTTTHVRVLGATSTASSLKTGEKIVVTAEKSGSTLTARRVIVPKPHQKSAGPGTSGNSGTKSGN